MSFAYAVQQHEIRPVNIIKRRQSDNANRILAQYILMVIVSQRACLLFDL